MSADDQDELEDNENHNRFPVHDFYREGVGFQIADELRERVDWDTSHHIDWADELSLDEDTTDFIRFLTAQLHFNNLAYLTVCRDVLASTTDTRVQELVRDLMDVKLQELDAWSHYLSVVAPDATLSQFADEYYQDLYDEPDALRTILGLEVISSVASLSLFRHMTDLGDPWFQDIAKRIVDLKQDAFTDTKQKLHGILKDTDEAYRDDLRETADTYLTAIEHTTERQEDALAALGDRLDRIQADIERDVPRFYEDIGLT